MKLRLKINIAFSATFIIIALIYSAILVPFEIKRHDAMIERIKLSLIAIVEQKKEDVANEIFSLQTEALRISLDDLLKVKDIVSAEAYSPDGEFIAGTEKAGAVDLSASERNRLTDHHVFFETTFQNQPVLTYLTSIEVIGKEVGFLKIHSSLVDLKNTRHLTLIIFTALLLTILVVIYGLLNRLLVRSVLQPVLVLKSSMEHIQKSLADEKDDLIVPNEPETIELTFNRMAAYLPETHGTQDEIGLLARSFKQMVTALQVAYGAIQDAEAKYRSIFENAVEGIFQISPEGAFISANPSAARLLGYASPSELMQSVTDVKNQIFLKTEDLAGFSDLFNARGHISGVEIQLRRKDGGLFWGSVSAMAVTNEDGAVSHYEGSFIDITESKEKIRAEKEREAAEAATQAKSDFLASMSHEIRTPLNAVIGLTELALRTRLDAKQKDYLKKVALSANSLLGIINDILDFSKIEAGKLGLEKAPFFLPQVLEELNSILYIKTAQKGLELLIHFDENIPWHLVGDGLRLQQVLLNLVNNAIKFTDRGEIIIHMELVEQSAEDVGIQFSVTDTGIGIPEEKIARLFQSFEQADSSTTRKYGGTGLGLAICKQLVKLMQGRIRVKSEPGRGSTFIFDARFGVQTDVATQKPVPPPDLVGLKVLAAENNAMSRQIIEHMLCSLSFAPVCVTSAEDVLTLLKDDAKAFDLVIMAWRLKGMDGLRASEIIKNDPELAHMPIIMISAYDSDGNVARLSEKIGVNAFLTKPLNPSILFDAIMDIFGYKGLAPYRRDRPFFEDDARIEGLRGARILLVEDNDINRQVAGELLESKGLIVDMAVNGREAVESAARNAYDAVLMDIQMPVMDGYTATQRIIQAGQEVPIIAMTAHAMAGEKEKCLEMGMKAYVTKPIDVNQLFNTLHDHIAPQKSEAPAITVAPKPDVFDADGPELPAALPGFDIQAGLARVAGNKRLYRELLLKMAHTYCHIDKDIQKAIDASDLTSAWELAHKVKGMAGNLGAVGLEKAAFNLEKAASEALAEEINDYSTVFSEALRQTVISVGELEKKSNGH